jgi:hypothetical protein
MFVQNQVWFRTKSPGVGNIPELARNMIILS